ncbi:MAG: hypothetical protein A3A44_00815 [Candidatus Sungbacteria bacterium RIFCSPLOWO2_01_FULL_60_25]|uniref:Uncharacterized protein n=1 Tax=Candidatus Sungbacteria bacterium RIFCSPLOWO2_01_FULL_60_25 TaxID=1802281 RepID=A0A1G2LA53_9BACT|nr:MAG: hypothetical protein A3A44_00815 [Candidatus Sungbacteria bacterium RIFCSPLOWO2_01_FULL_60_25]
MDPELRQKLEAQDQKLDRIERSVEQTRRYFLITLIVTAVVIVLPLLGLVIVIPQFLSAYNSALEGL